MLKKFLLEKNIKNKEIGNIVLFFNLNDQKNKNKIKKILEQEFDIIFDVDTFSTLEGEFSYDYKEDDISKLIELCKKYSTHGYIDSENNTVEW